MVYFSARTSSTPAWRKAATAQATARLIAGEPVIRPPTSSVSRLRFSSSGDGPSAFATIFGMASSHSDADVAAEHPPLAAAACMRASGSGWARGICATAGREARRRSEEHTSELQSPCNLVCRLLLEKKKKTQENTHV